MTKPRTESVNPVTLVANELSVEQREQAGHKSKGASKLESCPESYPPTVTLQC